MANVTYLLGAGASANCLPTYSNFKERFQIFIRELEIRLNNEFVQLKNDLIEIGNKIIGEFEFHNTPDTIAKKYFHQGKKKDLANLKKIVTLFFIYEQSSINQPASVDKKNTVIKSQFDKRYDSFLASILQPRQGELKIFNQFKLLTWNYDLQFEKAYSNYADKDVSEIQHEIQSIPSITNNNTNQINKADFSIIHLNGIASPIESEKNFLLQNYYTPETYPFKELVKYYEKMTSPDNEIINSNLVFAWENYKNGTSLINNSIINNAIQTANNTEILVIIGYSFPIFNREIDKLLFEEMRNLKKVYVQTDQFDKIGNILENDFLKSKRLLIDGNIINVGYFDQFFIPPEWDYRKSFEPYVWA